MKRLIAGFGSTLVLTVATTAWGQHGCGMGSEGHEHGSKADTPSPSTAHSQTHGGCIAATKVHHFEVVYMVDGIRVYLYDARQNPISAEGIKGRIALSSDDGTSDTLVLAYRARRALGDESSYQLRDYLFATYDLAEAKPESFQAKFSLTNLPISGETQATFAQAFSGVSDRPFMCPMHPDVWGESTQSKCPLCGMKTSDKRPDMAGSQKREQEHEASHNHGR